jgi:hypothetical protein
MEDRMDQTAGRLKNDHALNIFISWELKKALLETANRFDRSVAAVVRLGLRLSLPILQGLCETEERLKSESAALIDGLESELSEPE